MTTPGQARRDAGAEAVDAATTAPHRQWKPQADAALAKLIKAGHPFTADDLAALVDQEPHHPNAWGALFLNASQRGEIRKTGYTQSKTKSRHAGSQSVWTAARKEKP